ncbi:MAG: ComF family protein [Bacteroidales bacterium]|nr:ComF family protein [Bacteroidales bacterium]
MADLPLTHFEGARVNPMADKLNSLVNAESYLQASALFYYTGEYKKITQALKYGRNFGAGHFIAGMLGRRLASSSFWAGADVVCPVPLHWTRRLKRGYNQAEVIAQDIARELGAEYVPGLLRRIRRTGTQTRLASDARAQNVAAAFEARPVWPRATTNSRSLWERGDFSDGAAKIRILLVDDVCTTGATLAACCRALMDEFGNSVEIAVATLAYVD